MLLHNRTGDVYSLFLEKPQRKSVRYMKQSLRVFLEEL